MTFKNILRTNTNKIQIFLPELVVLVDFKAIYPGVPPGIFASFPGVAHFLKVPSHQIRSA